MKINVHDIAEGESIDLGHEYNACAENLDFNDLHHVKPIVLSATVLKEADCLFIEGTLSSVVEQTCARCLTVVDHDIVHPLKLNVSCEGVDEIDITNDIRELLIFEHPIRFVCDEACQGLCPQCGKKQKYRRV